MRISAEVTLRQSPDRRRTDRSPCDLKAGLEHYGPLKLRAKIVNVSSHGCRLDVSGQSLPQGATVSLKVNGWDAWEARVIWSKPGCAGLEFVHPLHPSFVQRMIDAPPRFSLS